MTDLIFPLNRQSSWSDNELRFSLRSIHKHLKNVGNIYVIGAKPQFSYNEELLVHLPSQDESGNKEYNIYKKILSFCGIHTGTFLFFNDDHFLLQDFDADTFPFFHKADLSVAAGALPEYNFYRQVLERTRQTLVDRNLPTLNFDSHCPILYDAERFMKVMPTYDWSNPLAFTIKSLYANTVGIEGVLERDGKFAFIPTNQQMLVDYTKDRKFFSSADHSINLDFATFLETLYPEKSPWEM